VFIANLGAQNSQRYSWKTDYLDADLKSYYLVGTSSVDSSASKQLTLTIQHDTADTQDAFILYYINVEQL